MKLKWLAFSFRIHGVHIHIGTLFAGLTETVPSLRMHRHLSAINRNSNGNGVESDIFSNYADKRSYVHKKEVYHGTLECLSSLFSCFVYSYSSSIISYTISRCLTSPTGKSCSVSFYLHNLKNLNSFQYCFFLFIAVG